jgi:hypothetical protein
VTVRSLCGVDAEHPLDRNIYSLVSQYGSRDHRSQIPAAEDPEMGRQLRSDLGFGHKSDERRCTPCSRICNQCRKNQISKAVAVSAAGILPAIDVIDCDGDDEDSTVSRSAGLEDDISSVGSGAVTIPATARWSLKSPAATAG